MILAVRYKNPKGSTVILNLLNLLLFKVPFFPGNSVPLPSVTPAIFCAQLVHTTGKKRLLFGCAVNTDKSHFV